MWRRCPECLCAIWIPMMVETCICPECGAWFHPEHALSNIPSRDV